MQKEPTASDPRCLATTVYVAPHSRPQPLPALQQPLLPAAGALSLTNQKAVAAAIDVHATALHLRRKQGGAGFGQLALRRLLSAPDRASGGPELRPASANQPLGPRWPATSGLVSTWSCTGWRATDRRRHSKAARRPGRGEG